MSIYYSFQYQIIGKTVIIKQFNKVSFHEMKDNGKQVSGLNCKTQNQNFICFYPVYFKA